MNFHLPLLHLHILRHPKYQHQQFHRYILGLQFQNQHYLLRMLQNQNRLFDRL
jgi:hypothetical protein